jgi:hypothetical protein
MYDELNKARIADLRRRAERDRLVRACAQARRARAEYSKDLASGAVGVFGRRLLIIMGARGA